MEISVFQLFYQYDLLDCIGKNRMYRKKQMPKSKGAGVRRRKKVKREKRNRSWENRKGE